MENDINVVYSTHFQTVCQFILVLHKKNDWNSCGKYEKREVNSLCEVTVIDVYIFGNSVRCIMI